MCNPKADRASNNKGCSGSRGTKLRLHPLVEQARSGSGLRFVLSVAAEAGVQSAQRGVGPSR